MAQGGISNWRPLKFRVLIKQNTMCMPHPSHTQQWTETDSNGKLEGMQQDEEEEQVIYEL